MKKYIYRYSFFIVVIVISLILIIINRDIGIKAYVSIGESFKEMLLIVPPIFILLGLLDVWVEKEKMIKLLGKGSGLKGNILSILMGSFAAGPLYAAFPIAVMLIKKGTKYFNVMLFIGAWSTTKVPMVLFEISSLGLRFAMTRLILSLLGIITIALAVNALLGKDELLVIYNKHTDK